jgi:hypothetical protein
VSLAFASSFSTESFDIVRERGARGVTRERILIEQG